MKKIRKKYRIILLAIILVIAIGSISVMAKYVGNAVVNHFGKSNLFYFTSDILDNQSDVIDLYDQGGKTFSLYLYNYNYDNKNNAMISKDNISYTVTKSGIVTLSSSSGTLSSSSGTVKAEGKIDVTIPTSYTDGAEFTITASATSPYKKTLTKKFRLHKKRSGTSTYLIEDNVGSIYATLNVYTTKEFAKGALTFDWTASTSKGIDIDTTNKYIINSDYSVPSTIKNKVTTNTVVIEDNSKIQILIFKKDKSEYFGTGTAQSISNNKIIITKKN